MKQIPHVGTSMENSLRWKPWDLILIVSFVELKYDAIDVKHIKELVNIS